MNFAADNHFRAYHPSDAYYMNPTTIPTHAATNPAAKPRPPLPRHPQKPPPYPRFRRTRHLGRPTSQGHLLPASPSPRRATASQLSPAPGLGPTHGRRRRHRAVVSVLLLVLWILAYALRFVNSVACLAGLARCADDSDNDNVMAMPLLRSGRHVTRRYLGVLGVMMGSHLVVMVAGSVWLGRMVKAGVGMRSGAVDVLGAGGMTGMAVCHILKSLGLAVWYCVDGARESGEERKDGVALAAGDAERCEDVAGNGDDRDRLGFMRVLHPSLYFI
ncbi:Citron Rho-interacting kinase [Madurella mycetomatis]|uniref:Citron Rho-interacting kinase n=1 Tax=Madurella mycetomatis TaxID=100816 RepID=A0A175W733_9PEZI|nr:Citron Rho-interacting kinase [Madurella mycetomatis]